MTRWVGRGLCVVLISLVASLGLAIPALAAAPTITSFTPTSGPLRTSVKITGSGFVAPVTVKFNNTAATSVVVNSPTQVTAQVPGSANSGPIKVTTGGGTATSTTSFTVTPGVYLPVTAGPPSTKVAVYFSGFTAYEAVDVYFDSTDLKLVSASSTGSGVATPIVPAKATPGEHFISAVGRKSGVSAQGTFTVRTDWPQFANNSARTGENDSEAILGRGNVAKLTRTWNGNTATNPDSRVQPIVVGGVVYTVTTSGVTASSMGNGAVLWQRNIGPLGVAPVVTGGVVVAPLATGHVVGLNAVTGTTKYDVDFKTAFYEPLSLANGLAYGLGYLPADDATSVIGFNPLTGAGKWTTQLPQSCTSPAASAAAIYTTCDNGTLYSLRTSDGAANFADNDTYTYQSSPMLYGGRIIVAGVETVSSTPFLIALDASSAETYWAVPTTITTVASITAADNTVVVRGRDENNYDRLWAYRVGNGADVWIDNSGPAIGYVPTIANGVVYVPNTSYIETLDLTTGEILSQMPGAQWAVVVDAGLITAGSFGKSLQRFALPASQTSAAKRPDASRFRPNTHLKLAS